MNVGDLSSRLKAELCRNKAKSAVLVVMCLVASYFWIPLLGKWLFKSGSSDQTEIAQADVHAVAVPSSVAAVPPSSVKSMAWQATLRQLKQPLMKPVRTFSLTRNPFANSKVPEISDFDETNDESKEEVVAAPVESLPPTFAELDIVLNGTLVGSRSRMATINGSTYRENETIQVAVANAGKAGLQHAVVELETVHANHVIVSYEGGIHKIALQRMNLPRGGKIAIFGPSVPGTKH